LGKKRWRKKNKTGRKKTKNNKIKTKQKTLLTMSLENGSFRETEDVSRKNARNTIRRWPRAGPNPASQQGGGAKGKKASWWETKAIQKKMFAGGHLQNAVKSGKQTATEAVDRNYPKKARDGEKKPETVAKTTRKRRPW